MTTQRRVATKTKTETQTSIDIVGALVADYWRALGGERSLAKSLAPPSANHDFTRDEMRAEAEAGTLVLPGGISISRSLIEAWYGGPLPGQW